MLLLAEKETRRFAARTRSTREYVEQAEGRGARASKRSKRKDPGAKQAGRSKSKQMEKRILIPGLPIYFRKQVEKQHLIRSILLF